MATLIRPAGMKADTTRHVALVLGGFVAGSGGAAEDLADTLRAMGLLADPAVRGAQLGSPNTHPYGSGVYAWKD